MVYIHSYGVIKQKITLVSLLLIAGLFAFLATVGVFTNANAASGNVVYDALPSVTPQTNYPSQPFQAQQTLEFGDYVHLAGTARDLDKVTVTMVTWARYSEYVGNPSYSPSSWSHPITLTVYSNTLDGNGEPTTVVAQKTQDITIPWRPEASPECADGFKWKDGYGNCVNGLAFNATFDMGSLNATLPDDVIISVAFNTQSYGTAPIGTNGPFNSLNVAVPAGQVSSVGKDDNNSVVFWNTLTASWYTDGGPAGFFRKDTNWAPYGTVPFRIETKDTIAPNDLSAVYTEKNSGMVVNTNGYTDEQYFTFTLNANGDPVRYQLKYWNDIADSPYKEASPWAPTDLSGWSSSLGVYIDNFTQGEGTHYFAFSACDAANNCSPFSAPFVVTYDKTAPAAPEMTAVKDSSNATIVSGGFTNSNSATAYWTEISDAVKYEYTYWNENLPNSMYGNPSTPWTAEISGLSTSGVFNQGEGQHYLAVRAVDAAGNKSVLSNVYAVFFDETLPNAPGAPSTTTPTASTTQTWTWTAAEDQDGKNGTEGSGTKEYLVSINNVDWVKVTGTTYTTNFPVGNHTLWVKTVDNAGNVSEASSGNVKAEIKYVTTKDECKYNGWQLGLVTGRKFKNQGDCVSHFSSTTQMLRNPDLKVDNLRVR